MRVLIATAATLALLLPAPRLAAAACGGPDRKGRVPRMPEVLACQRAARDAFEEKSRKRTGREPSAQEQDRFDESQRAQMRAYMEKYPAEATIEGPREEEHRAEAAGGAEGVLGRIADAVGLARKKLTVFFVGEVKTEEAQAAETEARRFFAGAELEAAAAKARRNPAGALKRAVKERNEEFEANVPEEAKAFYKKPKP